MIVDDTGGGSTLLVGAGLELRITRGSITLDESAARHVTGRLELAIPDDATLDELDATGQPRRVQVVMRAKYPGAFTADKTRTFDLHLRGRPIRFSDGVVRLELASDEALLEDDLLVAGEPLSMRPYEGTVRGIVNAVLARIGAVLEPGPTDAPYRVLFDVRNLLHNPGGDVDLSAIVGAGNVSFNRETVVKRTGAGAFRLANVANGLYAVMLDWTASQTDGAHTVSPGEPRNFSIWARANTPHNAHVGIRWLNSAGVQTGPDELAAPVPLTTTGWKRISVAGIAPAGTVRCKPIVWGNATVGGSLMYVDDALLADTLELVDAFDGNTPDTEEYGHVWDGAAGVSQSRRHALINRSPDSLEWEPGRSALDFLSPILQAAGMRLYCDERRRWHLIDGATFTAPGTLTLTMPGNLHTADETTDRDAGEWYDAAVVRYRWRRADGTMAEAVDHYAAPGHSRAARFELDAPYPGPGRAAYKVKRAAGVGRTYDVTALSNLDVAATQLLRLTLPGVPQLLGVVRSVEYDLEAGTMRIGSRGLVDVDPDSWLAQTSDLAWSAAPAEPWTI